MSHSFKDQTADKGWECGFQGLRPYLYQLRVEPDAQDISLPPDQITGAPPAGAEG